MADESFFRESVLELALMQAEQLVGFLNQADAAAPSKEVWHTMQVFELCQHLHDHLSTLQQPVTDRHAHHVCGAINRHLGQFPFFARLGPWRTHPYVSWRPTPALGAQRDLKRLDKQRHGDLPLVYFHLDMIRLILSMTEAGTIGRIRKCICSTWFFAQTNKKRVCSNACRFQKFSCERADYMRRYRRAKANLRNDKAKNKGKR